MTLPDLQAMLDRFLAGFNPAMHKHLNFLVAIVDDLKPRHILEVGTGDGWGARLMMQMLPKGHRLTTVKLDGQNAEALEPWIGDKRLKVLDGNVPLPLPPPFDPVDLLFLHHVGSPQDHFRGCAKFLDDPCVVAVDSVNVRDPEWWKELPYQTITTDLHRMVGFGLFTYSRISEADIRGVLEMGKS